jgi:hypothetical protein
VFTPHIRPSDLGMREDLKRARAVSSVSVEGHA